MRRILVILALITIVGGILSQGIALPVEASTTRTFYSSTSDGYVYATDDNYTEVQSASSGSVADETTYISIGQDTPEFTISRGYVAFDTSELPDSAVIDSLILMVYGRSCDHEASTYLEISIAPTVSDPLAGVDYESLGTVTDNISSIGEGSFSTTAYNSVTLSDGDSVVNRTGSTRLCFRSNTDADETESTAGNFSFWSNEAGITYQPRLKVTYHVDELGEPDEKGITNVKVFTDFDSSGDQLFVFMTKMIYTPEPEGLSSDYYCVQLIDNSTVVAQTSLVHWGFSPGSIYLSGSSALEIGGSYTLKVMGYDSMFTISEPYVEYSVTNAEWRAYNQILMKAWVYQSAAWYEDYTGDALMTADSGSWTLSAEGSELYLDGVPGLDLKIPEVFWTPNSEIEDEDYVSPTPDTGLMGTMGTAFTTVFSGVATMTSLSTEAVGCLFWVILAVVAIGLAGGKEHKWSSRSAIGLPLLLAGAFFNESLQWPLFLAAFILFIYSAYTMYLRRGG